MAKHTRKKNAHTSTESREHVKSIGGCQGWIQDLHQLSTNLGGVWGWVCCVIDGIISPPLFYFIINNKTRRIIDFANCNKELRNKVWKKFEWFLQITWTTLDPPHGIILPTEADQKTTILGVRKTGKSGMSERIPQFYCFKSTKMEGHPDPLISLQYYSCHSILLSVRTCSTECFHVTSRRPCWCP